MPLSATFVLHASDAHSLQDARVRSRDNKIIAAMLVLLMVAQGDLPPHLGTPALFCDHLATLKLNEKSKARILKAAFTVMFVFT